jgi:hypothetical protein
MSSIVVEGNADLVRVGPGKLFVGPFGSALPTTLAGAVALDTTPGAYREVGFTTEGNSLTYSQTSDGVEVAERLRPIKSIITGVEMSFEFTMAQLSPENLALATNAGPGAITTTADEITFTWPKAGGTTRVSLIWLADDALEALVLAKCFAGGDIEIPRRKGVDPAAVGVTFTIEENPDGEDAWLMVDPALVA